MKHQIEMLKNEEQALTERLIKINTAIKALQDICQHVPIYKGSDHNHTYFKCGICGYQYSE